MKRIIIPLQWREVFADLKRRLAALEEEMAKRKIGFIVR
jgi:hypothetical protein